MCGIAGLVRVGGLRHGDVAAVHAMTRNLHHRGPDDHGLWVDEAAGVALGHTRLAIVDLTEAGQEPITSADGRTTLVFNGEVFNHLDLRPRLKARGIRFRGHCDAETLVESMNAEGESVVPELRGFFAFGIWEADEAQLILVRDRLGKKPLFYTRGPDHVVFASELRALLASGLVEPRVDPEALARYLAFGSVPAPLSMIRGVASLPPGSTARFRRGEWQGPTTWWEPPPAGPYRRGLAPHEIVTELGEHLRASVADRLIADVPIGAFLSSGLDSAVVVALMREMTGRPVETYTVGFEHPGLRDERPAAARMARQLRCPHTELTIPDSEVPDRFDAFLDRLDQPSGDAFNTYLVAASVDSSIKVILSGVGADELFYGYRFWRQAARMSSLRAAIDLVPRPARVAMAERLGWVSRVGPTGRMAKAASILLAPEAARLLAGPRARSRLYPRCAPAEGDVRSAMGPPRDPGRTADLRWYLSPVLLADLDSMTMAHSLEARAPFLDHRLVEWAMRLPPPTLWDRQGGKAPLRQLAASLFAQPPEPDKQGFELPFSAWLAGPLRQPAEQLVASLKARGLDAPSLDRLCSEVFAGKRHPRSLWHLLVLEGWLQRVGAALPAG